MSIVTEEKSKKLFGFISMEVSVVTILAVVVNIILAAFLLGSKNETFNNMATDITSIKASQAIVAEQLPANTRDIKGLTARFAELNQQMKDAVKDIGDMKVFDATVSSFMDTVKRSAQDNAPLRFPKGTVTR